MDYAICNSCSVATDGFVRVVVVGSIISPKVARASAFRLELVVMARI
jgi:hypothetical protein